MVEWDYSIFWNEMLKQVKGELDEQGYSMWFSSLDYLRADEKTITIGVPSPFFQAEFSSRFLDRVEKKLRELTGKDLSIQLEIFSRPAGKQAPPGEAAGPEHAGGRSSPPEKAVNPSPEPKKKDKHPQLREDFVFERYIIGKNNRAPANAAMAIAKNPGKAYNPFFLYGGVGLGKTHLIQAIGNYIHQNSNSKITYITAEDFLNEYVDAIRENKMPAFRNKFRRVDVLLIDDIHYIQGDRPGVQDELFLTFDSLQNERKQLIFTCDRPASELKQITERLKSRFNLGYSMDIDPPDFETRFAILRTKAQEMGISIPDGVITLISENISSNIRELEGALRTLVMYAEMISEPITLELAQKKLKDKFADPQQGNISVENIQRAVAEYFSLSLTDLIRKKRTKKVATARQIAMYIAHKITDYSTIELGQYFGGRDHATVIYSCQKIEEMIISDPNLDSTIQKIERTIKEKVSK
jgi:chromosomal replication initiator protein